MVAVARQLIFDRAREIKHDPAEARMVAGAHAHDLFAERRGARDVQPQ